MLTNNGDNEYTRRQKELYNRWDRLYNCTIGKTSPILWWSPQNESREANTKELETSPDVSLKNRKLASDEWYWITKVPEKSGKEISIFRRTKKVKEWMKWHYRNMKVIGGREEREDAYESRRLKLSTLGPQWPIKKKIKKLTLISVVMLPITLFNIFISKIFEKSLTRRTLKL